MAKRINIALSVITSRLTSLVSVSLVLLLVAGVALGAVATSRIVDGLRSRVGFVVMMEADATGGDINAVKRELTKTSGVASVDYSSPDEVQNRWIEMTGAESAESEALELIDVNPFLPEFEVTVKGTHANSDSMRVMAARLKSLKGVNEVGLQSDVVDSVNSTMKSVTGVLGAIALALLIVSGVLIANTVRLEVYARRFTIHTMWLVGATRGFIRRPFVKRSIVTGLMAGAVADGLLAGALAWWRDADPQASMIVTWSDYGIVACATVVMGMIVTGVAATLATNVYLGRSFNDLFK